MAAQAVADLDGPRHVTPTCEDGRSESFDSDSARLLDTGAMADKRAAMLGAGSFCTHSLVCFCVHSKRDETMTSMPRPRTGETPIRHVRVPDDEWVEIQRIAEETGRTATDVVRAGIRREIAAAKRTR